MNRKLQKIADALAEAGVADPTSIIRMVEAYKGAPRYVSLQFDVPSYHPEQQAIYSAISRATVGYGVRTSQSCWVLPIGLRHMIEQELKRIERHYEVSLTAWTLAFDPDENRAARQVIVANLQAIIEGALASYKRSIAKVKSKIAEGERTNLRGKAMNAFYSAKRAMVKAQESAAAFEEGRSIDDPFVSQRKALEALVEADKIEGEKLTEQWKKESAETGADQEQDAVQKVRVS